MPAAVAVPPGGWAARRLGRRWLRCDTKRSHRRPEGDRERSSVRPVSTFLPPRCRAGPHPLAGRDPPGDGALMRTAPELRLDLRIDRADPLPLPRQVADGIRELVARGVLGPDEPVPATRPLAAQLGVSRGTVVAAYDQLLAEGYLVATIGRGTVVNPGLARIHPRPDPALRSPARRATSAITIDLRPGRPWHSSVANSAWRAAWRDAASHPFDAPGSDSGVPAVVAELAEHLRRMRGVLRPPGQLFVTAGAREGLALLLHALNLPSRVGVENPGYPSLRRVPARLGASVLPLRADDAGLVIDELPTHDPPPVVLVTPSHQYPLGGSLPVPRRQELLAWAHRHGVWLVEDDYDSELRYTSQPLPALASLDDPVSGRVITLGTFSTTVGPGLGAGFLAAPRSLVGALAETRRDLGQPVSLVTQQALAGYLGSGELRRHTQRMRRLYLRRRELVVAAFADRPGLMSPMDGGLHAVITFTGDETAVIRRLAAAGVLVSPLSSYWAGAGRRTGIVLGFGGASEDQLVAGLALIRDTLPADG